LKILFLSQRVPYPPNRGDKITTWRLVERLGKRKHEVRDRRVRARREDLRRRRVLTRELGFPTRTVPTTTCASGSPSLPLLDAFEAADPRRLRLARAAGRGRRRLAPAATSRTPTRRRWARSSEPHTKLPRVMHFAELDSDKWRQYAERTRFPMSWVYRREHRTLCALRAPHRPRLRRQNVFCTPLEQQIFQERDPGRAARS
jgi:hypothetical protein